MRPSRLAAIAILLLLVLAAIVLLPVAFKAIPTRYAMRLPEPLQVLALPGDPTPVLPTAAAPIGAVEQLLVNDELGNTTVDSSTATPPPSPTPMPVAGAVVVADVPAVSVQPTVEPTATAEPVTAPPSARLQGITHKFQEWNNCGPATLAMALSYFQLAVSQTDTAAVLKPNPEDRNVSPDEMAAYVNDQTELNAVARANGNQDLLKRLLSEGIPVIIELGIEPPGEFRWLGWYGHYLLPVAYDDVLEQYWVYDSWFGTSEEPLKNASPEGRVLTYEQLAADWPQFNHNYIVLYRDDQAAQVAAILGDELDDSTMWRRNLTQAQADAVARPDDAFAWFNLGTAYNALGQYDNAALAYDQARAIGLPWRMLWYQFGPYEAYYRAERYEDVILLADVTLTDRPYFEESYYYKGLAMAALGDEAGAAENLQRSAELNPNFNPLSADRLAVPEG